MATNLNQIGNFLEQRDWNYRVDSNKSQIITGVKAENVENFLILIRLTENGEFVQFIAPQLLEVKDHVYKGVLMQTMAHIEYQTKMVRFEYDPRDGEIRASIELPLEDAFLTEKQFNRCLNGLIYMVDNVAMPRFKSILATGEDCGMPDLGKQLLKELSTELLSLLEQL